jgi:hypothetical protein
MTWVRFDDQFTIHRKVSSLSDAAYRLHTEAIFWCARNLTDGRIARDELRSVSGIGKPDGHAAELVRRGLWLETDDGWEVHDYLSYQPSRSKVLHDRELKRKAGHAGGIKSGESRRAAQGRSGSKREAKPKQGATGSVEHPGPSPSLREGTGDVRPASLGAAHVPEHQTPPITIYDDPKALEEIRREIHEQAEAATRALAEQRDRAHNGAAMVRSVLAAKVKPKPARRNGLDELRAATDPPEPEPA